MDGRFDARLQQVPAATVHDIILKIAEIDEFKGWWRGRDLPSPALLERLKRRTVELSARASTRIDGRKPARPFAAKPLPGRGTRGEAQREADYAEVLRAVFDGYRDMAFGEELILRLHAGLLRRSPDDQWHRGRYTGAAAEGRPALPHGGWESAALRPSDPRLAPADMAAATAWTVNRLASGPFHPLLVIAGFGLEFLAIRPFADGNGRLSRVLTNFLLLRCGYSYVPYVSLDQVIAEHRAEYYLALRTSQAKRNLPAPDISLWLHVFVDALRAQIDALQALPDLRPDRRRLSHNQVRVLHLLERHREVTNRLVCAELGIPKETAKQVLNRLVGLDLARRVGAGRAVRYHKGPAAADWPGNTPPAA